jgi:hypothetical protein
MYTPALSLSLTVLEQVAAHFDVGDKVTLTFSRTPDEEENDGREESSGK